LDNSAAPGYLVGTDLPYFPGGIPEKMHT